MDDNDGLRRELYAGISIRDSGVVPRCNLAEEYPRQGFRSELHLATYSRNVISRNHRAQHGGDVQDLDLSLGELLVGHGTVTGAKVYRPRQNLTNATAASYGLIINFNIWMKFVVLAEPFGIHRVRKSCARPVQRGLPQSGYRQSNAQ